VDIQHSAPSTPADDEENYDHDADGGRGRRHADDDDPYVFSGSQAYLLQEGDRKRWAW